MATAVLINSNIPKLKLLSKGKVRDIYATSSPEHLLFVASDRISAYDVILKNVIKIVFFKNLHFSPFVAASALTHIIPPPVAIFLKGIPDKGRVLTELSLFWFDKLKSIVPNHVVTWRIEDMPEELHEYREQLEGRSILVKKAEVVPLEAIVRGYITGEQKKTPILNIARLYFVFPFFSFFFLFIFLQVLHGPNIKRLVRSMGSRFQRASKNHKSSPRRSSRRPPKQNKGRMTRTSPQNKV